MLHLGVPGSQEEVSNCAVIKGEVSMFYLLVVLATHLKNYARQIGSFPQVRLKN